MTKKDYVKIADVLARHYTDAPGTNRATVNRITNDLVEVLKADNPRFDEGRFYAAVRGEA